MKYSKGSDIICDHFLGQADHIRRNMQMFVVLANAKSKR